MMFELQPTLRGTLVSLRPMRVDDYDALFGVASDPLIWEQHPVRDRYQPDVFRRFFDDGMASGGALVVVDNATGAIIGSSRFFGLDKAASEVEIGWTFLSRAYWGGRYNGEMKQLMLDHAFRFVRTVVFLIGPDNRRSRKAVEKIGAVHTGSRLADGRESVVYTLTRDAHRA